MTERSTTNLLALDSLLLADEKGLSHIQNSLFQATDILLTAGIVAGGCAGFNLLTKALTNPLPEKE